MNKIIYFLFFCIIQHAFGQENKHISFITTAGNSYRDAYNRAHNTAYMNNLKIISRTVIKNGDSWVATVKVVSRN